MSSYCKEKIINSKCSSPGCMKPIDDDHRYFDFHSISCKVCQTWKHWYCHGLTKTDYLLIRELSNYPFICSVCRKRCETNYDVKKILEEVINEKVGMNFSGNGNGAALKDFKVKIKVEFAIDPQNNEMEKRRSRYDPVPNPVAVKQEDSEPVYEIPKFLKNEKDECYEEGERSQYKCYYV